ncbi:MATE family efflux transporter [Desertibacillus haloalkaliphilus]|uniref:MATE family efflux transporter n=1 Tax=Desertibacillus haloalkaliphilus TaxID=1328930 RepID=UPI001C27C44F|nr:MATE family efflux transporter [Desertibacillus haloalkaliphilus]MBU8907938.1 MATE family efflux transporter [Desertibacillus haloalkaliphilus]
MHYAQTIREKIKLFIVILWPILVTQIGLFAMNFFDTLMSGRAGTDDLAGVAIGSSLWLPLFTGLNGVLLAVTPIVSQFIGSGERNKIGHTVTQALYVAVLIGLAVILVGGFLLEPILLFMNLEPAVHQIAKHYLIGLAIGIVPLFVSNVIRNFFDAQGHTKITMIITLMAIPFNILLNYGLIFGAFGLPELGGVGAGYATAITYWIIVGFSIWMTVKVEEVRPFRLFVNWYIPSPVTWKEILKIGIPIGLSIFFEASIFAAVTLMVGAMFDTVTIAAHQAAINFTTLIFMVPLSISMALTIMVGYEVGAKRIHDARQYTRLGVIASIGILSISSIFLYLFREQVAMLYSDHRGVVIMVKQFLIFAIFYQLSDAVQSSLIGVLRGYKDVTIPFFIALLSYWGVGIPSGFILAVYTQLGPYGYWIGITIGLTCAAVGFYLRLRLIQSRLDVREI